MYESWFISLYSVLYTSLPVQCLGLFDQVSRTVVRMSECYSHFHLLNAEWFTWIWVLLQDTSAENCLRWPELYLVGQRQELFNPLTLCVTMLYSIYTSIILFFLPFGVFQDSDLDYQTLAVTVEMSAVFSVTVEVWLFSKMCNCWFQSFTSIWM